MAAFVLFAFLFLCGLLNSLFFPHSKLLPWLRSLLSAISPPKSKAKTPKSNPRKDPAHTGIESHDENALDLKPLFATFDTDGDGKISAAELSDSLRRLGLDASNDDLASMMQRADSNRDGLIDLDEFSSLCASMNESSPGTTPNTEEEEDPALREAFEVFDGNGDGMIAAEELRLVLKTLRLSQGDSAEACRDMISRVDLNGDGMICFDEFKRMMAASGSNLF